MSPKVMWMIMITCVAIVTIIGILLGLKALILVVVLSLVVLFVSDKLTGRSRDKD